jgi:ribonuclease T2
VVHGSCSGLSAHDYFLTLIHAVGRLSIPSEFDGEAPRSMTASQITSAFVKANPSLTERSIALRCHGAQLEEVRICLSRDLHPEPCGRSVHTQCRAGPLTVRAAH